MLEQTINLSPADTARLRRIELELLRGFISVCERLELTYYIVQGTLLGAVRHGGFIPWDDDIDVGMPREDYEIFLKRGQALLPQGLFLQNHATDPGFMHCFSKLRRDGTVFMEQTQKTLHMHHGVYLDIFPLDYYPDGLFRGAAYDWKKLLIRYRVRAVYHIPSDEAWTAANVLRRLLKLAARRVYPTTEDAMREQERLYASVSYGKRRINNGSPWGNRERVPAAWLERTVPLSFEEMTVLAPSEYDAYLRHAYGDYMTLPPEEQRVSHHHLARYDFGADTDSLSI